MPDHRLDITTRAVTVGRPAAVPDAPLNAPVTLASTYVAGGEAEYGRYANPSWTAFEDALGDLEGGRCLAFASGMAAIAAVLDLLPAGARVVAPRHSYTGTIAQLNDSAERGRLTVDLVDITDTAAVIAAADGAACVWIESPTNPALEVADLATIAAGRAAPPARSSSSTTRSRRRCCSGRSSWAPTSSCTPATKSLAGHSDVLMGAAVVADDDRVRALLGTRGLRGAIPAPLEAFLALRGLRTLPVRLRARRRRPRRRCSSGSARIRRSRRCATRASAASSRSCSRTPRPPTASSRALSLWRHATSLGGVESTLERRRRWPAEAPTIPEGLVRLSVGLEHPDDLWADLAAALG